jgi:molybdopterin molybdotransferase
MLTVEQALEVVAAALGAPAVRRETVPLARALGRVLAEDVAMDHDVPPFTRATMDGYAVRSADARAAPASLRVVGVVTAGSSLGRAVGPGEAARITTGAPLPAGADAVVAVERTRLPSGGDGPVEVLEPARASQNVAFAGEQARTAEVVARAGTRVSPGTVGVLGVAGRAEVVVAAPPRVAILCTGDELVPVGTRPGPSQIRDSNGYALAAQVASAGGAPAYAGAVRDDVDALSRAVRDALASSDFVCLSGGVSMGERDFVPAVLEGAGVERLFHRWAVKPGGPLWAGRRGGTLVFGLPGNPAATFVGFEVLVVPALRARLGLPFAARRTVPATWAGAAPRPIDRRQYVPVALERDASGLRARPVRWKGSGDPFGLAAADALAVVHEGAPVAGPDPAQVPAIPLGDAS